MTPAKIIEAVDNSGLSVTEVVNVILEARELTSGQKVAILDGTPYGLDGMWGKIKGPAKTKTGFVDVELPNGVTVAVEANLLLPVPA